VLEAKQLLESAKTDFTETRYEESARVLVAAVRKCPYVFPVYSFLLESLVHPECHTRIMSNPSYVDTILLGIVQIRDWLQWLREQLARPSIPDSVQPEVASECIAELDVRAAKLADIEQIVKTRTNCDTSTVQNPLSRLVQKIRQGEAEGGVTDTIYDVLTNPQKEDLENIRDSAFGFVEDLYFDVDRESVSHLLDQGLLKLASRPPEECIFPNPHVAHWREKSGLIWAQASLPESVKTDRRVAFHKIEALLSTERNPDGTVKRPPHRKTDHLGTRGHDTT
jgi:hypothetical protein